MTDIRTQDKRHWIQAEMKTDEGNTAFIHIDLNMVDNMVAIRRGASDEIIGVQLKYYGLMKPLAFDAPNAAWVYEQWKKFVDLHAQQGKSKPSIIHTVSTVEKSGHNPLNVRGIN